MTQMYVKGCCILQNGSVLELVTSTSGESDTQSRQETLRGWSANAGDDTRVIGQPSYNVISAKVD